MASMRCIPSPSIVDVPDTLDHVAHIARHDLPFALRLTRLAHESTTLEELQHALEALYRLTAEHEHAFAADLVDDLLGRVERALDDGCTPAHAWRSVI